MNELILTLLPAESHPAFRRHACEFRRSGGEADGSSLVLHFDVPADLPPPAADSADPFVIAALFLGMLEKRRIVVRGSVCAHLAENLEELALAWKLWNPERYTPVGISADRWREPDSGKDREPGAVAAFSGGLDATHLAWTWIHPGGRVRIEPLRRLFLVHGFDIPLADPAYEDAYGTAFRTAASIGLKMDVVRTNFREVLDGIDWIECYGAAVASCLHFYRPSLTRGLIASGQPYDRVLTHGSSPMNDVLFSSHDFRISHHGAAYDRTEKLEQILGWKEGVENLRVCWQKEGNGTNCGVCEKCVRTRINFWAAGSTAPPSLGQALTPAAIIGMRIRKEVFRSELVQILLHAKKRGLSGPILTALGKRIRMPLDEKRKKRGLGRWLKKLFQPHP